MADHSDSAPDSPRKRSSETTAATLKRRRKASKGTKVEERTLLPRFELQQRKTAPSLSDIRNLVLWVLTLEHGSTPQWIFTPVTVRQNKHEVTQLVVLFLPGLDAFTLKESSDIPVLRGMLPLSAHFTILRSTGDKKASYLRQVIESQRDLTQERDSFDSIPPLSDPEGIPQLDPSEYEKYILTENQLADNQFPMECEEGFVEVTESHTSVPAKNRVIAVDCEMVRSATKLELARVSLVNLSGEILYDAFVKPQTAVTDYLTQYSGITANTLQDIQLTLEGARTAVLQYVGRDTILCGHSLENDLRALQLVHKRVIDTSVIYPHNVKELKWSLKRLAERYLRVAIQSVRNRQKKGHDSVEDARAALSLVREKVRYGPKFGVPHPNLVTENILEVLTKYQRKSAFVGFTPEKDLIRGNVTVDLSGSLEKYIGGEMSFVVSQWTDLLGCQDPSKILSQWNERLRHLITSSPQGTGWILATGESDSTAFSALQTLKKQNPQAWSFQQEQQLRVEEARGKKTFGVFFFPGQIKVE